MVSNAWYTRGFGSYPFTRTYPKEAAIRSANGIKFSSMNLLMLNVCAGRGAGEAAALTPPTADKAETGPCQLPPLPRQCRPLVSHDRPPWTPSGGTAHGPRPAPRLVTCAPELKCPGEPPTGFTRPISRPPTLLACIVRQSIRTDTATTHSQLDSLSAPARGATSDKPKTAKIDSLSNHFVYHRYNQRNSTI